MLMLECRGFKQLLMWQGFFESKSSTLSKEVFYEQFKHLFSDNDAFTNDFVETQVNDNEFNF